ncbi:MAG TPA: cupin domain-containing protein [Thermoanaerobaculia bacterium]|nr:cupin domain-containing protein [Thermoanaerobaculia bacterium]
MDSIIAGPTDGARLNVTGEMMRVLATAEQTGDRYEVFVMEAVEGSGPPPHAHPWSEAYFVLEGETDVYLNGRHLTAVPGCFLQIPAGTFHAYRIKSKTARFLVVTSARGAVDFMREVDAETNFDKVVATAVKHGFTVPSPRTA